MACSSAIYQSVRAPGTLAKVINKRAHRCVVFAEYTQRPRDDARMLVLRKTAEYAPLSLSGRLSRIGNKREPFLTRFGSARNVSEVDVWEAEQTQFIEKKSDTPERPVDIDS